MAEEKKIVKETVEETAEKAVKAVEEKAAETKPAAKATAKKAAAKTKTAAKATVKKTATAAKTAAKKTTEAAKTTAKKAAATKKKAAVKQSISVQFAGKEYTTEKLVEIAKDVWQYDLGKDVADFKEVQLYVKPEEFKAYYVINGTETGSFNI